MLARTSAVLVAALCLFLSAPLRAQTTPAPDGGATAVTAEGSAGSIEKVEVLREAKSELARLESEFRNAQGDNKDILAEQVGDGRGELLASLAKLMEDDEPKPPELTAVATEIIEAEWQRTKRTLTTAQRRLRRLLATRSRKRGADLIELDDEVHEANVEIDELLSAISENAKRRESLGKVPSPELEHLKESVPKRAEQVAASIRASQSAIKKLSARRASSDAVRETKQDEIGAIERRLESSVESLTKAVALLKKYEIESTDFQQLLIESTGDITTDILDSDVAVGLGRKYLSRAKNWVMTSGPTLLFKLVLFLLILFAAKLLSRLVRRVSFSLLGRSDRTSQLFRSLVSAMAARLTVLVGLLIGLWQFGFSPTSILAGLGLVGLVIGLALQSTLSSFAAGTLILLYRPYDIGDLIESNGHLGTVLEMTLMTTSLLTVDNQRVVLPNNKVWGEVIKSVNAEPQRRVDMVFGISYADDVDRAKELIEEILSDDDRVLAEPESIVRMHELNSSSVDFAVRPWWRPRTFGTCTGR